jgi:uncharacterized protein
MPSSLSSIQTIRTTMKIKTEFPRPIREIENTWITMSDSARLAARIWIPVDAESNPVPAILEYIPYRKSDGTAQRDALHHPYFAGHGYASVRVDMRGSGESDGILYDEYLKQEQDDALEVITWLATQPWCTGSVGIVGKSWGGFNGLQIAARRPPELKAVISLYSTDDRYADDVHYMGGCLLGAEMLPWASVMFAWNARPPDPLWVGDAWREMWLERLEKTPPFVEEWMRHPRRDAFWKHGSVCEDFSDITCPVYAIGGWPDGYTNAVLRLLEGLPGPRKGLIGPWGHEFPDRSLPGPNIGYLQEALRWWDYWLKGIETGIMDEPMLRVWMQETADPRPYYESRQGRWVAEPGWPSPNIEGFAYNLNPRGLDEEPGEETLLEYTGVQSAGLDAGLWCVYGVPGDLPTDQRAEDGMSLSFTSEPVGETMEIFGFPEVTLKVAVDKPNALLAVRLCDVSPTGASLLVTRGLLNLTHRESHEHPTPLEPGKEYTVTVGMNAIAHSLQVGHRWRVSVSPTYWPHAWPSPEPVRLTLFTGEGSRLTLPVRSPRAEDADLAPFEEVEQAAPLPVENLRTGSRRRWIERDVVTGLVELKDFTDHGNRLFLDNGLEYDSMTTKTFTIKDGDPLSAKQRCEWTIKMRRGEMDTRVETDSLMTADAEKFYVTNIINAYEKDTRVFSKAWIFTVERDLV